MSIIILQRWFGSASGWGFILTQQGG